MISDAPKDEFNDYIPPQQHGYTNLIGTEPYFYANYMNMHYSPQAPVSDATGAWSASGATDSQIAYITSYEQIGTFDGYGYGFQPAYNQHFGFTGTGEFAPWAGIANAPMNTKAIYDEYYQPSPNNNTVINQQDTHIANEHLNKLENGISNLTISSNMTQSNDKESHSETGVIDNKTSKKDKNNNNTIPITASTNTNNTSSDSNTNVATTTTTTGNTVTSTVSTTNATTTVTTVATSPNNNNNNIIPNQNNNSNHNNSKPAFNNGFQKNKQNNANNNLNSNNNSNTNANNNSTTTTNTNNNNNNNNNNNKSWASVVCSQSYTSTTASNKKIYTAATQNPNLLQTNTTNVITYTSVGNSAIISPNRQQQQQQQQQNMDIQYVNNHNKHTQPFNNQLVNPNYNYSNYYKHHNYTYYNQPNSYYQGHYSNSGRRGQQSFNQNSNTYNNNRRNYNNYTTTCTTNVTTTTVNATTVNNNNNNLATTAQTSSTNNANLTLDFNNLDNSKNDDQNTTATTNNSSNSSNSSSSNTPQNNNLSDEKTNDVLTKLKQHNQYNPKEFNLAPKGARFFVIKSYSEDDVHRSIKYNIWCSTEHGNRRLDQAFREREGKGPVYLFFSVNGSGHFCGMAEMMSCVDYDSKSDVWSQDKWKGKFEVKWIYVKDVPNSQLRNIRLENNENKPVTNSRDTQEIPLEKGKQVLKVFHHYRNTTSIFDDFEHYEKRQDEDHKKPVLSVIL